MNYEIYVAIFINPKSQQVQAMKKLHGVVTAMTTPFTVGGEVNISALKNLTNFYISRGVNCLYPCGTTGEMFLLSVDERKRIAETVIAEAAGRVTVFIHVGAMNLRDTLELARHAHSCGADGIGVVTPAFFGVTEREIIEYYAAVSGALPDNFPVYLYNIPQLSGNDLLPAAAIQIAERCKNVVGIKYSYPDFLRTSEYLRINNGAFSVLVGTDRLFFAGLSIGCAGLVSGISSVFPEPFVALFKAFKEGNLDRASALQQYASQISEILHNGANMAFFKAGQDIRGLAGGHMRAPLLDLPEEHKVNLRKAIEAFTARVEGEIELTDWQ